MFRWFLRSILLLLSVFPLARGEGEWRKWTSKVGTRIEASVISVSGDTVTLKRKADEKPLAVKITQLSEEDQAFLREFQLNAVRGERGETRVAGIDAKPGITSDPISCGDGKWTYHLYLPKDFHTGEKWPVWFIMSPGGGAGGGALNGYIEGAERLGAILALSVESKNDFADSDLAMEAMVDDVYGKLPVYEELGFASGFSGGSRMAYLLAERDKRIAGVLACGSGSGVYLKEKEFRDAELRRSTYIYSLMGTNCFNRSEAVESHQTFPKSFRLRFFPGDHVWADAALIAEAMARVLGEALKTNQDKGLEAERFIFAETMSTWMDEMIETEAWEAAYWADFLTDFPGQSSVALHASSLGKKLKTDPKVMQAINADKDIGNFTKKHFNRYISLSEGKQPDSAREEEAESLSKKYPNLPHAEILSKLGKPS